MKLSEIDLRFMRENAKISNSDLSCALDFIENLKSRLEKLEAVLSASATLVSEMENENKDHGTELPTHFNIWFILKDAIAAARKEE